MTVGDNANFDSIIVRMDGKDITADAVTNMNIHIGSITGDVVMHGGRELEVTITTTVPTMTNGLRKSVEVMQFLFLISGTTP